MSNLLDELKARGILDNVTSAEKFLNLPKGAGAYIGFDPTADSLHLGNYAQILMLLRFKQFGFSPIAVIGGATGQIGDPSGRSTERPLSDLKALSRNKQAITKQLEKFGIEVVDNLSWYKNVTLLQFLRDVGKLVNVSVMLSKESVKTRLEGGLSFTEFSYQLIQGWDFYELYKKHNVFVQVGGSDQWGNITTGLDIIHRLEGENKAVGLTIPLLTTKSGQKFGKSAGNALWLDVSKTPAFALYQFLINVEDADLRAVLMNLTLLPFKEVEELLKAHAEAPQRRIGQARLASDIITRLHGAKVAAQVAKLAAMLYDVEAQTFSQANLKLLDGAITTETFESSVSLLTALLKVQAASSNREAREFIHSGAISLNGKVVKDEQFLITLNAKTPRALIRRGKRNFYLIKISA